MKYSLIIACLVFSTLFSCKENSGTESNNTQPVEVIKEDFFKITLDVVIKKDDNFHLYYTEDGSIKFTEEKSIWTQVKGSDKPQSVVFSLPKDVLPTAIRFDLGYGANPTQSEIEIVNFNCSYFGKSIDAKGNAFFDYFYPTQESSVRVPGTSKLQKLDKNQVSGSVLYPNENLLTKIKSITKG